MNQWLHTNDILSCTACCFWGTVFSHWWGHLKLGHRFHAPTKVCSHHCPFKPCICIICRHRLVAWSIRIRCWTRVARGSNHHLTRTRDSRRILWTSWRLWGLKTSASGSFPSCTIASKARFNGLLPCRIQIIVFLYFDSTRQEHDVWNHFGIRLDEALEMGKSLKNGKN